MALDGLFLHFLVDELSQQLVGGRINKISQPFAQDIVCQVRANRQTYYLLLSVQADAPRLHCVNEKFTAPENVPNFCMVLRKRIEGGIIKTIRQRGLDRIVTIVIEKRNELGDIQELALVFELMGRHSNLSLVQVADSTLIDCIKHVSSAQNRVRQLRPGIQYEWPPMLQPLNIFDEQSYDGICDVDTLTTQYQGFGRESVQQILAEQVARNCSFSEALSAFLTACRRGPYTLTTTASGKAVFTLYPFAVAHELGSENVHPQTLSALLEQYYSSKARDNRLKQIAGTMIHLLTRERQKLTDKIVKLEAEHQTNEKADQFRIYGELLQAYGAKQSDSRYEITVPNYYDEGKLIRIPLLPEKTLIQNAQHYFKKYQKAKNSLSFIAEQKTQAQAEIMYIDSVLTQIQLADLSEMDAIKEELVASGYLRQRQTIKRQKKQSLISQCLHFVSADGTAIRVGKNNLQNDELTLKYAKNSDIWLHTKDIPGSHVIVEASSPSEDTLQLAAQIAAYYSKFRSSANVPVDYVAVKHIRKPKGAKPGYVIYDSQQTLYVTPDWEHIQQFQR